MDKRDEAVTRFAVETALRGVEEGLARARSESEREALCLKHAELRTMLPAQAGAPQPRPEDGKMTWGEFFRAKIAALVAALRSASTDQERQGITQELCHTETCAAILGTGKSPHEPGAFREHIIKPR